MDRSYEKCVEAFAAAGADLIAEPIAARYGDLVPVNPERPLEPGFVPPRCRPKIVAVSHYPNDGDLRGKVRDYEALRERFVKWGADRTVASYRVAYADWLDSVPVIPFHLAHTLPVLKLLGIDADEIAWLPLVKAPMRPRSKPRMAIVRKDRKVTMEQLGLIGPQVVWVQGIVAHDRVGRQIRDNITEHVAAQDISSDRGAEHSRRAVESVAEKLANLLLIASRGDG
jgi:hypothetical protein